MNMTMYELLGKLFPTMKPLDMPKKSESAAVAAPAASVKVEEKIDFS